MILMIISTKLWITNNNNDINEDNHDIKDIND